MTLYTCIYTSLCILIKAIYTCMALHILHSVECMDTDSICAMYMYSIKFSLLHTIAKTNRVTYTHGKGQLDEPHL